MIYVASPFSDEDKHIEHRRYRAVEKYTVELLKQHSIAFSPIVYCYPIHINYQLPGDAEFWKRFNIQMMMKSDQLHVLKLPGWEESKGVQFEVNWWKSMTPHHIAKSSLQYIEGEDFWS